MLSEFPETTAPDASSVVWARVKLPRSAAAPDSAERYRRAVIFIKVVRIREPLVGESPRGRPTVERCEQGAFLRPARVRRARQEKSPKPAGLSQRAAMPRAGRSPRLKSL